jgi:hypothetical protein
MEQEKIEKKEIIVLDEGIDTETPDGPDSVCCWVSIMPLRW